MYIYIRAMSESQSEIYRKISDKADTILEHIIKLMLYPDASSCDHWKAEIYAALNRVQKLRNNNKLPKPALIYKALSSYNDVTDNIIKQVKRSEKEVSSADVSAEAIVKVAEEYQHWLSDALSRDGFVAPDDVFEELHKLLNL